MKLYTFTPGKWTARRLLSLCFVVLLVGSGVGAAISVWSASAGTSFNTSSGVEVNLVGPSDEIFQTGSIFTDRSIYLHNTSFHGNNATVQMANNNWNGTTTGWVNTTAISMSGNLTIDTDTTGFTPILINGSIQGLNFTKIISNDGKEDLVYTTNGTATIVVGNLTALQSWGLVDVSTLQGYDVAVSNATGFATFDQVPAGTNVHASLENLGI